MADRIVWSGSEDLRPLLVPLTGLWEDPQNARVHSGRSISAITASLDAFGQESTIVITADGQVKAGNGTFRAAGVLGWTHLAATVYEDAATADEFAIADNRSAEHSTDDQLALARAFAEVAIMDPRMLESTGFTPAEQKAIERAYQRAEGIDVAGAAAGSGDVIEQPADHVITLELPDSDAESKWWTFLDWLRDRYPGEATIGGRLAAYLSEEVPSDA